MSRSWRDGGPAYPVPGFGHIDDFRGMSLRDYFAAKAMQSCMQGASLGGMPGVDPTATALIDQVAQASYAIADAMLKARQQ